MAGATATPATIGGPFTRMVAYFPSLVVENQDGGRISQAGYVGSAAPIAANSWFTDDGSATGVSETWTNLSYSEDRKYDVWSGGFRVFSLGTSEPLPGYENQYVRDTLPDPPSPTPIDFVAYYNNDFEAGYVGPSQTALRYSGNWVTSQYQPAPNTSDLTGVKCYPGNQVSFPYPNGPAISLFSSIMAYADVTNPATEVNPDIIYEAAWDCYGFAHWDRGTPAAPLISLEVMFWTYNHNQSPHIGPLVETGVDLKDGRGPVWDLYMTADSAATGGVNDRYSYGIWYLQDQYQVANGYVGWVNILYGIRYFSQYYVTTTGGAPANPLDVPMYQVTRGWEVCSTEYSPLDFRMNDYKIIMT